MKVYELEIHLGKHAYEFLSSLDLEVGKTYMITDDTGYVYSNRVRIIAEKDKATFSGQLREIVEAKEDIPW